MSSISSNNAAKSEFLPMRDSSYVDVLAHSSSSAFTPYHLHVNQRSMTQDSAKKINQLCVPDTKHDNKDYKENEKKIYLKKNEKLANKKFKLFGHEIELPKQVDEENEENVNLKKNEKLAKEKFKLFGHEIEVPKQVMEPKTKKEVKAKRPRSPTEDDEKRKMKKMKRKIQKEIQKRLKSEPPISNDVTERLRRFITGDDMNGSDLTLVIQKLLYYSDLKPDQNRLTMPFNQLETFDFLKPHEKTILDKKGKIDVQLLGPTLKMYQNKMTLTMWSVNSTQSYALQTKWNDFVKEHKDDLMENAIIQVWSFRKDGQLCFALAIVERAKMM